MHFIPSRVNFINILLKKLAKTFAILTRNGGIYAPKVFVTTQFQNTPFIAKKSYRNGQKQCL
jgi:hypothetical protein